MRMKKRKGVKMKRKGKQINEKTNHKRRKNRVSKLKYENEFE